MSTKPQKLPEKQPYHHGDLRAALIAAALSLIGRHGVQGFTLKDAARIAGVSVAAPYRHFADKEALIHAIQHEGFAGFDAALAASVHAAETPHDRLLELGVAYVRFAIAHPAHFQVMFGGKAGEHAAPPLSAATGLTGYGLLLEAVAELDPHASAQSQHDLVLACWSIVHGYTLLYLDGAFTVADPETQLRRSLTRLIAPV